MHARRAGGKSTPWAQGRRHHRREWGRQWGKVREDYSPDGSAWEYSPHDRARYATDPHFRDLVLFHEHFHGDDGRGLGASHQTGWTALAANVLERVAWTRAGAGPFRG